MPLIEIFQGESLKRLVQGAAAGAIATMVIGFSWGGWMLGGTAAKAAEEKARTAVTAALAPICVDKFQQAAGSSAALVEFKKVASYQQGSYIEKGGWATLPGSDAADFLVAQACARMLSDLK